MSAAPDIMPATFDHRDKVIDAQLALIEENSHIIRGLRKQNERLKEERLNVELEASVAIATAKLGQAQAFQRITALEKDINDLRNWIAGNLVQRDQEYENMRGNVSYLMGAHAP